MSGVPASPISRSSASFSVSTFSNGIVAVSSGGGVSSCMVGLQAHDQSRPELIGALLPFGGSAADYDWGDLLARACGTGCVSPAANAGVALPPECALAYFRF